VNPDPTVLKGAERVCQRSSERDHPRCTYAGPDELPCRLQRKPGRPFDRPPQVSRQWRCLRPHQAQPM